MITKLCLTEPLRRTMFTPYKLNHQMNFCIRDIPLKLKGK